MSHTYPFPRPQLTVDAVVFACSEPGAEWMVLLIQRGKEPYKGCWAFPGGYFDMNDASVEFAAVRELEEETGVQVLAPHMKQLQVFSAMGRDPRGRTISVAHVAFIDDGIPPVEGRDDAAHAEWVPISEVSELDMAFDHKRIFARAMRELLYQTDPRPEYHAAM